LTRRVTATSQRTDAAPTLPPAVAPALLAWYARRKRDLPWRAAPDPYGVLVAEFMLQQTQADRVAPRYLAFRRQFPDFAALAAASRAEVLRAWSGLGYNMRALRLQAVAREVVARYGGALPSDVAALQGLHGVGRYTAGAIAAFAFGQDVATVDTNIRRVLQRLALGVDAAHDLAEKGVWALAERSLPAGRAADWNQALMDLGATICTARAPACPYCPLEAHCAARREHLRTGAPIAAPAARKPRGQGPFAGSSRYYRGRIVRALTELGAGEALPLAALGPRIKEDFAPYETGWLHGVVDGLARDGLVRVAGEGEQATVALPEAEP
jgi:A/G-specific adenine glycosylase